MTERLREALHDIGDAAPVARVPDDVWARGRRARRRDQLLAAAAVLVLVAGVAGLVRTVRPADHPPVTSAPDAVAAVPDHLYAVPERLTRQRPDGSWSGPVESDPAVGRASVAFLTPTGLPVVITAADGRYHLLDLPGPDAMRNTAIQPEDGIPLALSPDGRRLAYVSAVPLSGREQTSEVRVVDLENGDTTSYRIAGNRSAVVDQLVWSPAGRWLVWSGLQVRGWTAGSGWTGTRTPLAGRIGPGAAASEAVPATRAASAAWAIDDAGRVAVVDDHRLRLWDGHFLAGSAVRTNALTPAGAFDGTGTALALGSQTSAPGLWIADPTNGEIRARPFPRSAYPQHPAVRPLGWTPEGQVVAAVTPFTRDQATAELQVAVMTPRLSASSTYRIVTHTDADFPNTFTVATDLLDRPTQAFDAPRWPWSTGVRLLVLGSGVAVVALAAFCLVWVWRRRRGW